MLHVRDFHDCDNFMQFGTNCPLSPHEGRGQGGYTPLPGFDAPADQQEKEEPITKQPIPIEDRVLDALRDNPDLRPTQETTRPINPPTGFPPIPPLPGLKEERERTWVTAMKALVASAISLGFINNAATASRMERVTAFSQTKGGRAAPIRGGPKFNAYQDLAERLGNSRYAFGTGYKFRRKEEEGSRSIRPIPGFGEIGSPDWPFDWAFEPGLYYVFTQEFEQRIAYIWFDKAQALRDSYSWAAEQSGAEDAWGTRDPRSGDRIEASQAAKAQQAEQQRQDNGRRDDEEITPFNG